MDPVPLPPPEEEINLNAILYSEVYVKATGERIVLEGEELTTKTVVHQLLDSGSNCDSVDYSWLKQHGLDKNITEYRKKAYGTGFGGEKHRIIGQVPLDIKYGKKTYSANFYVFEAQSYKIILGAPFFKKFGLDENLQDNCKSNFGSQIVLLEKDPKNLGATR